jgi:Ca2+-binding EF-hand superfamily protein
MPKTKELTASEARLKWTTKSRQIGQKIMDRNEVSSGFADITRQAKHLQRYFHFYDSEEKGYLTFRQFLNALKKMNFLGCEREAEDFFAYYDDHFTGNIAYNDFCQELYNIATDDRPRLSDTAVVLVEDIRAKLTEKGGASGFSEIRSIMRKMSIDGKMSRGEVVDALYNYCGSDVISTEEMTILLDCFDYEYTGSINVDRFVSALIRGSMSYDRKLIVNDIFTHFDSYDNRSGTIALPSLIARFDASFHPEVISDLLSIEAACEQFFDAFSQGGQTDGKVNLAEFLDYFKGLSLSIKDDNTFDLLLRNILTGGVEEMPNLGELSAFNDGGPSSAVNINEDMRLTSPPSSPTLRRFKVTTAEGKEEIHSFVDDIGMGRLDVTSAKERVRSAKGIDNFDLEL